MIPKFKINRSEPQPRLNRAFLWQAMTSTDENFSKITRVLDKKYGQKLGNHHIIMDIDENPDVSRIKRNIPDISNLSDSDVLEILKLEEIDLFPAHYYFWFGQKDITGIDDFRNFPELYTEIEQVSFDKGGLILLKSGDNNKKLFTSQGLPLTELTAFDEFNHEYIHIGIRGLVINEWHDLMRQDEYSALYILSNNSLKKLNVWEQLCGETELYPLENKYTDVFNDSFYFHKGSRDIIEEMLPGDEKLTTALDFSKPVTPQQLDEELQRNPHAEIFFREQYSVNKTLAAIVLKHKPIAYSCLSRKLQNDRSFIIEVIKNNKLYALYPFLRRNLRADREIIEQSIYGNPELFSKLYPVDNEKLIKDFIYNYCPNDDLYNFERHRAESLSYASERIRSDRHFILNLSEKYPDCLNYASPKLKRDKEFVLDAIQYNPLFIQDIDKTLQEDPDIIREAKKRGWQPDRDGLEGLPF